MELASIFVRFQLCLEPNRVIVFVDQDYFSRGFVFFVRRGDGPLKAALDYGLDQLQQNGEWDRLFRAYVPANPW